MHKTVDDHRGCWFHTKSNGTKHDSGLHVEAVLFWGKIKQRLCYVNKTQLQNNETKKTSNKQQDKFSVQSGSTAVDKFTARQVYLLLRASPPPACISVWKVVTVCHIKVKHVGGAFYPELCVLRMVLTRRSNLTYLRQGLGITMTHLSLLSVKNCDANDVSIHTFQIRQGNLAVVKSCCQSNTASNRLLTHFQNKYMAVLEEHVHARTNCQYYFLSKGGARINNNRTIMHHLTVSRLCSLSNNN